VASYNDSTRRGRGWLAEAGDAVISVLFPADCRLCESLLTHAGRVPICNECLASFAAIQGRICEICGAGPETPFATRVPQPGPSEDHETDRPLCSACRTRKYAFDRARSYALYEAKVVRAILTLKFERMDPLGAWFAARLAEVVRREQGAMAADLVVPVPLHPQRQRERGYNQADLIARPLAKLLGLPYRAVLLMRMKPRPEKQVLSVEERWQSVRGAFATRPGSRVDNQRVLLVDDVMTTGATLDACARALREAGATAVIGLTVARAVRLPVDNSQEL
jgi:ComF family protein